MDTERQVWIVNKSERLIDVMNLKLKRQILLKPQVPIPIPFSIGLKYVTKFQGIAFCDYPEAYFKERKLKQLIIRDAGIGDLLLLEPVLRKLSKVNRDIDIASRYPDVFENYPYVTKNIFMPQKENLSNIHLKDYDTREDLRNYSETSQNRDKKHRTDIYNDIFKLEINEEEKQPRIYFNKSETSLLKKKEGYRYIGIQSDASHSYRRYERGKELIEYLLKKDRKNIVVILGSYDYIKDISKNKRIIDLQGNTTIRECINVVRNLDYIICADSGLMHIALTLHVPTVCMFSIITPDFRVRYYKGHRRVIWKDIGCRGCGNWHMHECSYVDKKKDPGALAPCMNIDPAEIYDKMLEMPLNPDVRIYYKDHKDNGNGKKIIEKEINIIAKPITKKLILPIIVLNEEKNLPRFIENVMNHPCIEKTIAIDGGSNDKTVKLLESAGAYVYTHIYDETYHDMQAMQRNYSCSFIRDGQKIIIMDIDESFSKGLSDYLSILSESNIEYGLISRRTFNHYKDITDPARQIKDYPDYQPRFFTWNRKFKWVGSPHHNIYNCPEPVRIDKDIIHFEKENKDRDALEKKWAEMQKETMKVYA